MPKIVLTLEEEKENLDQAVALANDYGGYETTWKGKRYGPEEATQFRRLLHALREWDEGGSRNIGNMKLDPRDRADLEKYTKQIHAYVERNGTFSVTNPTSWNEALVQFWRLLNNSQRDLLGGPCRNRKKHEDRDHWFVKKTHRPRLFCSSPLCAGDATKANERQRNHKKKIETAERAMRNYPKRPARFSKLSWQEYVIEDSRSGRGRKPSISKKFLTMAVNGGHLVPPAQK